MDSTQDYLEVEVEVEVPSHFRCPISIEFMRDPVTISTGVMCDLQEENMSCYLAVTGEF